MQIFTLDRHRLVAVAVASAGSQTALAARFGVRPQAVQYWLRKGCPVGQYIALLDFVREAGNLHLVEEKTKHE